MAIEKWERLESREVFTHPRIRLTEDRVRLPNGHEIDYLRASPNEPSSVAVIALNGLNQILLQREYSYPPDVIMWQLPGGSIENPEDVLRAANRELSEESGLIGENCDVIGYYYTSNRYTDQKQHVVLCTGLTPQQGENDPEEFIEPYWKSPDEIKVMSANGEFHNVYMLAALSIYFAQADELMPPA